MSHETMTEEALLSRLRKVFAEGTVYASQLRKREKLFASLNRLSRDSGQTAAQWLASRGLLWAETGYVEMDMRPRGKATFPNGFEAFDVAHFVFRKYPLVGAYALTPEEDRLLYQASKVTLKQFLKADYSADRRDCAVLILESVRMLRGFRWPERTDGGESAFWRYLFQQFGIHTENSGAAEERLIDGFTMATETVMDFYKRFFAPKGRTQYSSTLLLHALAPRDEMEDLFRILFNFYTRTLRYQYRAGDVGFGALADGLIRQWEAEAEERARALQPEGMEKKPPRPKVRKIGRPRKDEQFEEAPPPVSAPHALFRYRPDYAVALCDELVRKMDLLIRQEKNPDAARDYWDALLSDWYHKKSGAERVRIQEARRASHAEYVAVSSGSVSVRYAMEQERVGLEVPGIRLPFPGDARPTLRVYQSGQPIYDALLDASGVAPTTVGRFLPLDTTRYDFSRPPELRAEIEYMGGLMYQSGEELRRPWLMFDEAGNQRTPKAGNAWLFAGNAQEVAFQGGDPVRCDFPGQLYRVRIGDVSQLTVDGREAFSAAVSRFRHHTSCRRVDLARVDAHGRLCDLLPAPFQLLIGMTERDRAIRHSVVADGTPVPRDKLEFGRNDILLTPPAEPQIPHCIQVYDQNGVLKDEYNYMILNNCRVTMDRKLYREAADEAAIKIVWNGRTRQYALPLPPGMDSVSLTLPGLEYPVEIDVPIVHCSFMGRNAFTFSESVWHRDISPDETLSLRLPSGWSGQVMLGVQAAPSDASGNRFALGELLSGGASFGKEATLWISLWDGVGPSHRVTYPLTNVLFRPTFTRAPLEIESGKLLWQAEENFIGEPDSRFTVLCARPDGGELRFSADVADATLTDAHNFPEGRYDYRVFLADESSPLYDGSLIIGDKRKFAFTGKRLVITGALCWDFDADDLKTVRMSAGCGILRDLRFCGSSLPPGEDAQTPEYVAALYYRDEDDDCLIAFSEQADEYFEQVNPVTVWTVNEHLLILQGATGDTLYIDNQTATILYRNPDSVMSRDEQRERLETPDYFEYHIEDEPPQKPD